MSNPPPDDVSATLTDSTREELAVAAIRIITTELAALVTLRGHAALAEKVLAHNGDAALALKALRGEPLS